MFFGFFEKSSPPPSLPPAHSLRPSVPSPRKRSPLPVPSSSTLDGRGWWFVSGVRCVREENVLSLSLTRLHFFFTLGWAHRFLPTKLFVFFFENGETVGLQTVKSVTAQRCNKQSGLKSGEQQSPCLLVWRLDDEGDCCSSKTKKESHPSRSAKVLFFDAFRVTRQRDDG